MDKIDCFTILIQMYCDSFHMILMISFTDNAAQSSLTFNSFHHATHAHTAGINDWLLEIWPRSINLCARSTKSVWHWQFDHTYNMQVYLWQFSNDFNDFFSDNAAQSNSSLMFNSLKSPYNGSTLQPALNFYNWSTQLNSVWGQGQEIDCFKYWSLLLVQFQNVLLKSNIQRTEYTLQPDNTCTHGWWLICLFYSHNYKRHSLQLILTNSNLHAYQKALHVVHQLIIIPGFYMALF